MQVSYVIVAKERQSDQMGNHNFLGVLNVIQAASLPVGVKELPIYAHFIAYPDEANKKQHLTLHVIDENGTILKGLDADVSFSTDSQLPIAIDSHFTFGNMVFHKYGWYTVNLFLDDELTSSYPFQVIEFKTE